MEVNYEQYWVGQDKEKTDKTIHKRIEYLLYKMKPKDKVLDIGCGDGFMTNKIYEKWHKLVNITGIDISETAIEKAVKEHPDINFIIKDCTEKYPFSNNYFDIVYSSELIEHLAGFGIMFQEIRRVLKPKGKLILMTPYHNVIKNLIIALFYFEKHYDPESYHFRFFTLKSLNKLLKKHGFKYLSHKLMGRVGFLAQDMVVCYENN